jgi:hypothetical protein
MDQVSLTGTPTSEEEECAVPEKGYDFPLSLAAESAKNVT